MCMYVFVYRRLEGAGGVSGGEPNREIVVCRSMRGCARVCVRAAGSAFEIISKRPLPTALVLFARGDFSLRPCENICSLSLVRPYYGETEVESM